MNTYSRISIAASLSLLLIASCQEEETPLLTGDLVGYAFLLREANSEGIEVTVEGYSPTKRATTDERGFYRINNLSSGTYNFVFRKEGYGTFRVDGQLFVGGNRPVVLQDIRLTQLSYNKLDSLTLEFLAFPHRHFLRMMARVSVDSIGESYRYYLDDHPEVSYRNYKITGYGGLPTIEHLSVMIELDTLVFPVNSTLYAIVYPEGHSFSTYTDIETGKLIFTAVNTDLPSNVASITVLPLDSLGTLLN